jgi:hypothetical protein
MRRLAASLALCFPFAGAAVAQDDPGAPYVQAFCALASAENGMGRLYLVTPGLNEAIMAALRENATWQAANPGEKPPLGDGVPWQSFPDVAPACEPAGTTAEGEALVATVKYDFPDSPDAGWTDRLVLVKGADGAFAIDDIRYGDDGEETLRGVLAGAFAQ